MCSGNCAKCLGITLIPLAIICVLCNILLFFPGGKVADKSEDITNEVFFLGGILGSGVLVSERLTSHAFNVSICAEGFVEGFPLFEARFL